MPALPELAPPKITQQPAVRLPSTAQIDARIARQTHRLAVYIADRHRLKDVTGHGRRLRGPRPTKPPPPVTSTFRPEGGTLMLIQPPDPRRRPWMEDEDLVWQVPVVALHPRFGPLFHLDSTMVMRYKFLRTVPSRRLLVVRGPHRPALDTDAVEPPLTFKAISQEYVRSPSGRFGYHRWLCYIVPQSTGM
jgi:hypothetical protein